MDKLTAAARRFPSAEKKLRAAPFTPSQLAVQTLMLVCGFLLAGARLFGDVAPFACALVAASPPSLLAAAFVGAAGRFIMTQSGVMALRNVAVLATAVILAGGRHKISFLRSSPLTAPLIAFICPISTGLTVLAAQGFDIDGLLLFAAESAISAGSAYFIERSFELKPLLSSPSALSVRQLSSLLICSCVLLMSASSLEIGGVAPSRIVAVYLILAASRLMGVSGGAVSGASMGFAMSLTGVEKSYLVGCYAFGGLVSGVFAPAGQLACAAAFAVSNTVIAIANADSFETLPAIYEAAVATIAFVLTPRTLFEKAEKLFSSPARLPSFDAMRRALITKLNIASGGMAEVAKTVESVSQGMKALEYAVSPATARANQMKEIVRDQFGTISLSLKDIAEDFEGNTVFDIETAHSVSDVLKSFGAEVLDCFCVKSLAEGMRVEATVGKFDGEIGKQNLMRSMERACGRKISYPSIREYDSFTHLTFVELPQFDLRIGKAQLPAEKNSLCGDCYECFPDDRGRQVIILSDGMGTGARAAVDGAMTSSLFAKLIKSGFGFNSALRLVNSALIVKSEDESLATLDVACIDLRTGEAEIMKAGAGATLLCKGNKLVTIENPSMPVGILREVEFEHSAFRLSDGDILIMASDGVSSAAYRRIAKILRNNKKSSPAAIAGEVAEAAREMCPEIHSDDITVIVAMLGK